MRIGYIECPDRREEIEIEGECRRNGKYGGFDKSPDAGYDKHEKQICEACRSGVDEKYFVCGKCQDGQAGQSRQYAE